MKNWEREIAAQLLEDAKQIRRGKEGSMAMDSKFYGDPVNHVEFESEIKRQQEAELKRQQKRKSKRKSKRKGGR